MTGSASGGCDFPTAERAGLAMLGGEDIITRFRGHPLRGHFWPVQPLDTATEGATDNGLVIMCPGFTEFCEKHGGTCRALHERGFDVLVIDWPGHGRSGHFGRHPIAVHIDSFEIYLEAMDHLLTAAGLAARNDVFLFGHSMGGHLALRLARRYRRHVRGVILSAPMILPPVTPAAGVRLLADCLCRLGWRRSFPPFHHVQTLAKARQFHPDNVLSVWQPGFEAQFIWMDDQPALRRSGPTVGWVRAAYASCAVTTMNPVWMRQLDVPVLALTAGDERVVHKPSTDRMLPCLPSCAAHEIAGARHELLQESPAITARVWDLIDPFLERGRLGV